VWGATTLKAAGIVSGGLFFAHKDPTPPSPGYFLLHYILCHLKASEVGSSITSLFFWFFVGCNWGTSIANSSLVDKLILNDWRLILLIKKYEASVLSLIITIVSLALPPQATAQSNTDIEKVRAKVQILAASKDSQVEVRFRDKTKIKGYIVSVEPVSFNLKDSKTGTSRSIAYSEIDSVSRSGGGSTKTWLIVGGVAAGVITTWLIVKPAVCDGGAQTRGLC